MTNFKYPLYIGIVIFIDFILFVVFTPISSAPSPEILRVAQQHGLEVLDEIVSDRTSHSRTFKTNNANQYVTEIIGSASQPYRREIFALVSTSTFNPGTFVDGVVWREALETWGTLRETTSGTDLRDAPASWEEGIWGGSSADHIGRFFFLFATGDAIPSDHTIDSATFSVFVTEKDEDYPDAFSYFNVVQSNPASTTALAVGDFSSFTGLPGTMPKGSNDNKDISASILLNQYNDWVLNSTGLGWIVKGAGGITKLGLAEGHDIEDSEPAGGLIDNTNNRIRVSMAESAGTNQDPKLVVVHSSPVVEVEIDIKPGSFPNSINRNNKGNIPVAIFSSDTFDAAEVDLSTVNFEGASPLEIGKAPEDVNGDGLLDIVFHFSTQEMNLPDGASEACITGETVGTTPFEGCDSVRLVK